MNNLTGNNSFTTYSSSPINDIKFSYTKERDGYFWKRVVEDTKIILREILPKISEGKILNIKYNRVIPKTSDISYLFRYKDSFGRSLNEGIFNSLLDGNGWDVDKQKMVDQIIIENPILLKNRIKDILFYLENLVFHSYNTTPKITAGKIVKDNSSDLNTFLNQTSGLNYIKLIYEIENIDIIETYDKYDLTNMGFNHFEHMKKEVKDNSKSPFNLELDIKNKSDYKVGILDGKIHKSFHEEFKHLINYESYVTDEEEFLQTTLEFSHMESVFSSISFGDKLNGFDDGAGLIETKAIAVLGEKQKNKTIQTVYNNIEKAVLGNKDIKVWILSLGVEGIIRHKNRISGFGLLIAKLSSEHDIRFFIAAGNSGAESYICPPSDSPNSITISALDEINGKITNYSSKGYVGLLGTKPNFSYFGGSDIKPVKVLTTSISGEVVVTGDSGTSYANPLAARLYSAIYHSESFKDHEKTLAIMNIAAIKNTAKDDYLTPHWIYGLGKLPNNLNEFDSRTLMNTKYTFDSNSKHTNYSNDKYISLPKISGEFPYKLLISKVDKSDYDFDNNVKFINSSVEVTIYKPINTEKNANAISKGKISGYEFRPIANYMQKPDGSTELSKIDNGKWVNTFISSYDIQEISKLLNNDEYIKVKVTKNIRDIKKVDSIEGWMAWEIQPLRELTPVEYEKLVSDINQMHISQNHEIKVETINIIVPPIQFKID